MSRTPVVAPEEALAHVTAVSAEDGPSEVPRHRAMRCAGEDCTAEVDREAEKCPECGEHRKVSLFRLSELGNADRFGWLYGDRVRHCPGLGGWLVFDGRRWVSDVSAVERLAKKMVDGLYADVPYADDRDDLLKHISRSETARSIASMLRLAQSDERVAERAENFDSNPWLLNAANGTVDLRTGELRRHRAPDLLTKMTAAPYEPGASSALWERSLDQWMGGDADLVAFLRRMAGYSLTGSTAEEKLFVVLGPGGGGKSTFVEAIRNAVGDYARTADFETFLQNGGGGIRNDIARLAGARFVTSIEVDDGRRLAEALVKSITGGDMVSARFLYREAIEYRPQFKLVLVANHAPRVDDQDTGMWRRIVRVPFEHPPKVRDPRVKGALCDVEVSGVAVLAWAVAGCLEWQRSGLAVPASIEASTEEYRQSQDPLAEFLRDEVVFEDGASVTRDEMRRRYEQWGRTSGTRNLLSPKNFAERLRNREGIADGKAHGDRVWRGVRLTVGPDNVIALVNRGARGGHVGARAGAPDSSGKQASGHVGHQGPQTSLVTRVMEKVTGGTCPTCPESQIPDETRAPARAPEVPHVPPRRRRSEARALLDLPGEAEKAVSVDVPGKGACS